MSTRRFGSSILLFSYAFLTPASVRAEDFATHCIVPNRAIAFYEGKLYAMEPGSVAVTAREQNKRYSIMEEWLPDNFQLVYLSAHEVREKINTVVVGTVIANKPRWLSLTEDGHLTFVEEKPAEGTKWRVTMVRRTVVNREYETKDYVLEYAGEKNLKYRYITVSKDETVLKNAAGQPLAIHPIVLGNYTDTVEFRQLKFLEETSK